MKLNLLVSISYELDNLLNIPIKNNIFATSISFKMYTRINIFLIFLAVMSLATGGIFVKLSDLSPINNALYRVLFSLFFIFPFTYKNLKKINKKSWLIILLSGVFLAIDLILWNTSFNYTSVANANLFVNMVPFTTIPLSYFLLNEKIKNKFLLALIISIIGIVILMWDKFDIDDCKSYKGNFFSFLASFFYGLFLLTIYKIRSKVDAASIMFISGLGALPVLLLASIISKEIALPHTFNELYILIALALFSQILGQGLLSYCLGKINIQLSSVIILTQPVFAAIYAFFIFHEVLTIYEIFGIAIILIGVYFAQKKE